MSDDAGLFTPIAGPLRPHEAASALSGLDYFVLHEGKTIHQFTDRWNTSPRYAIALSALADKPMSMASGRYFRAACREIARSTDERTAIAAILPPGVLCGHTISVERRPAGRPNAAALSLVALMNSFCFDWLLRQKASVHVSLYILSELPVPELAPAADRFLAHACLRLCCNHRGFAPLWQEQLGGSPRRTWPALPLEADRWRLRAAMDCVIALAYGLSRAQYGHVLTGFSHKSFPEAPTLCIAAFDELIASGVATFCRDHDPHCELPLIMAPARPVLELSETQRVPGGRSGSVRPRGVSQGKRYEGKRRRWKRKASTML
jgi:hypothetical protein